MTAQSGPTIGQRRINDFAGAIERCRREILDGPGLRTVGEPLPAYLDRVCGMLPGETKSQYLKRVSGYVLSLSTATDATAECRMPPTLKNADPENVELWRRIVRDSGYLPARMAHVQKAWRAAEANADSPHYKRLSAEVRQTLEIMIDAFSRLRDARP